MTRLEALRALYAAVKDGQVTSDHLPGHMVQVWLKLTDALNGSVDAALALIAATLPGWVWTVCGGYASVSTANGLNWRTSKHHSANADTPATALLLACIAAHIAIEEQKK